MISAFILVAYILVAICLGYSSHVQISAQGVYKVKAARRVAIVMLPIIAALWPLALVIGTWAVFTSRRRNKAKVRTTKHEAPTDPNKFIYRCFTCGEILVEVDNMINDSDLELLRAAHICDTKG
ncbi:hypothetical protein CJ179_38735 [Rhodococcus sp. ACS1]|uniref:hypothetical protein n=1 Tax=Rhodococcus sp. ACS1 TaxID=2028570 RepID=UPI000BB0E328|nr:hypothetical protein [Rhodococcus sp. ACS1]PBC38538.1 hypothetical protein CJ179_38735 [Rhodococcus sp. ACS1]